MSQLGKCVGHLRRTSGNGNPNTRTRDGLDFAFKFSRASKLDRVPRDGEGRGRTPLSSYYRIHGIALTSILVRNVIMRVIQVVIVTPLVLHGAHFSPPGGTRASLGRGGSFPGSLACSNRTSGARATTGWLARGAEKEGGRVAPG